LKSYNGLASGPDRSASVLARLTGSHLVACFRADIGKQQLRVKTRESTLSKADTQHGLCISLARPRSVKNAATWIAFAGHLVDLTAALFAETSNELRLLSMFHTRVSISCTRGASEIPRLFTIQAYRRWAASRLSQNSLLAALIAAMVSAVARAWRRAPSRHSNRPIIGDRNNPTEHDRVAVGGANRVVQQIARRPDRAACRLFRHPCRRPHRVHCFPPACRLTVSPHHDLQRLDIVHRLRQEFVELRVLALNLRQRMATVRYLPKSRFV
jgi:hypothetical protein